MRLEIGFVSPKVWPVKAATEIELQESDEQPVQSADDDQEQEQGIEIPHDVRVLLEWPASHSCCTRSVQTLHDM